MEARVPGRAHGLRKAGATIAANNGATAHQLMAIFGWDTLKMAEQYTRAADQKRLAEAAMHMLDTREQTSTESCPTETSGGTFSAKSKGKSETNFGAGAQERTVPPEEVLHIRQRVRPHLWSRCVPPLWPTVQPSFSFRRSGPEERFKANAPVQFESKNGHQIALPGLAC
jgi:hypothetical protein